MNLTEPQAGSDLSALRILIISRASAPTRDLSYLRLQDLHHLLRHDWTETSSTSCWRACRCVAPHRASRSSPCRDLPTGAQRRRLRRARAQARHPRSAHLHHVLRRGRRRGAGSSARITAGLAACSHHDEQRPPRGGRAGRSPWPSGRRRPPTPSPGNAAGPHGGLLPGRAWSRSQRHPDVRRMLATMRGLTQRGARHLPAHGDRPRRGGPRRGARGAHGRLRARPRCSHGRSPRPSRPTSRWRSPRWACRCTAAWASSRRPARRNSTATRAKILPIYEGTNGIQAIDLVPRASCLCRAARRCGPEIARIRSVIGRLQKGEEERLSRLRRAAARRRPRRSIEPRARCSPCWRRGGRTTRSQARHPYLRLFALTRGAACLAEEALAAQAARAAGETDPAHAARIGLAAFFGEDPLAAAPGLERAATAGASPPERRARSAGGALTADENRARAVGPRPSSRGDRVRPGDRGRARGCVAPCLDRP